MLTIPRKLQLYCWSWGVALRNKFRELVQLESSTRLQVPGSFELSPSSKYLDQAILASENSLGHDVSEYDPKEWQVSARHKLGNLIKSKRLRYSVTRVESPYADGKFNRQRIYLNFGPKQDCPIDIVTCSNEENIDSPIIICMQGYNSGAHLSLGEIRLPFDVYKIDAGSAIALQAAELGFRAISYERPCFGERQETKLRKPIPNPTVDASFSAVMLGSTLLGETISELSSLVDWACNQYDGCKNGIYLCGYSAAGTTAVFASALDERIDGIAIGGCVGMFKDTVMRRGTGGYVAIPGILQEFEFDSILSLIAPRICVLVSGVNDHIFPYSGAESCIGSAKQIFQKLNAEEALLHIKASGGHTYYPSLLWPKFIETIRKRNTSPSFID